MSPPPAARIVQPVHVRSGRDAGANKDAGGRGCRSDGGRCVVAPGLAPAAQHGAEVRALRRRNGRPPGLAADSVCVPVQGGAGAMHAARVSTPCSVRGVEHGDGYERAGARACSSEVGAVRRVRTCLCRPCIRRLRCSGTRDSAPAPWVWRQRLQHRAGLHARVRPKNRRRWGVNDDTT